MRCDSLIVLFCVFWYVLFYFVRVCILIVLFFVILSLYFFSFFFFFQAEDGIRDTSVTGVQTCALPICQRARGSATGSGYPPSCPVAGGRRHPRVPRSRR